MLLNSTPFYVGTSGYNHEDWKGNFAPKEIDNYDLLSHYAKSGLNFLEIAFTFYRMPEEDKIRHILLRTGDKIKFSVRLPKQFIRMPENDEIYEEFMKGISPLVRSNLLACVYADFHSTFSVSKKNQELILALKNRFDVPFFAELPNRTWYKNRIFDYFKEHEIGMSIIDVPQIAGIAPYYPICTNNNLYFKLYGKDSSWVTPDDKFLDYSYSRKELDKFLFDAVEKSVIASNIFMVFANVAKGNAPANAVKVMGIVQKNTNSPK